MNKKGSCRVCAYSKYRWLGMQCLLCNLSTARGSYGADKLSIRARLNHRAENSRKPLTEVKL